MAEQRKPRSRKPPEPPIPLGSISRGGDEPAPGTEVCGGCGGTTLTRLRMTLTDGTPVVFVSCQDCERTAWFALDGSFTELTRDAVIDRSGKKP